MEFNFNYDATFEELYRIEPEEEPIDPLAKLPEEELVSEDEFISMMVGVQE